jgi:hypothetical protein
MALTIGCRAMDNVVGIGIDHQGDADKFDTDPEKTFLVRSRLKLMALNRKCHLPIGGK